MTFRINNIPHYFETLPERFNAAGAKGVKAIYQFELAGDEGGTWHAEIKDQAITVHEGAHDKPTTTLKMNADEFVNMTNGDLDGNMAYMSGKLKIAGNLMMAMKMRAILPQAKK